MNEPPRPRAEPVLPLARVARIFAYGVTMMAGTLAVLYYGLQTGGEDRALTLAFTTFVLFQFFNVFNARSETGSAFNADFFRSCARLSPKLSACRRLQISSHPAI